MRQWPLSRRLELIAVVAVLAASAAMFVEMHLAGTNRQSALNWIATSWLTLLALAAGLHLIETGPIASSPLVVLRISALVRYALLLAAFIVLVPHLGSEKGFTGGLILVAAVGFWLFAMLKLFWPHTAPSFPLFSFFGRSRRGSSPGLPPGTSSFEDGLQTKAPKLKFRDVAGQEAAKDQIRRLVETRLQSSRFAKQGIVQNGILLYGPQGTGKTLLAEATAGEFGLRYFYVSGVALNGMWVGETEQNIRQIFSKSARGRTVLFLDEIDSLGAKRNSGISPGTGMRGYNNMTIQLMQCIDRYRQTPGLVVMAATNALDSLDPALIREGRFDVKIRLDLPDEAARAEILVTLLAKKGAQFPVTCWAHATSGSSPAKLNALVDRAAAIALTKNRTLQEEDLAAAFEATGGQGTGKTMIARLLATQTKRSFYPVTAADLLGSAQGESVQRLAALFARAREQSPSIIFFDELDGLFGQHAFASAHDTQFTEQALIEISRLEAAHNVLLVGATNHPDHLDPRLLRGGRFSEKIEIGVPGPTNRQRLLEKLLAGANLAMPLDALVEQTAGMAPADIEAVIQAARRFAFGRSERDDSMPPLEAGDFERAIERVHPARYQEPAHRTASA